MSILFNGISVPSILVFKESIDMSFKASANIINKNPIMKCFIKPEISWFVTWFIALHINTNIANAKNTTITAILIALKKSIKALKPLLPANAPIWLVAEPKLFVTVFPPALKPFTTDTIIFGNSKTNIMHFQ